MCGIAGYYNIPIMADERVPLLARMCEPIVSRGPDDDGYFADDYVGLGMRRLSIIDLSTGHQPMTSRDGTKHIVFNGEIYNYGDIRNRLETAGRSFVTTSDTEVVLQQYEAFGDRCLDAFNGMFAIAIWDARKRRLLLARDRLGVKPLYYHWNGRSLLFASEIKSLLAGSVPRIVNPSAIWHYLTFRYVPQPMTIWQNVWKLLPGHLLTIEEGGKPVVRRWWSCPEGPMQVRTDGEYVEEFSSLLRDSVRLRLIADVPVGVLLSGGIDSAAVLATAASQHAGRVKTFSVGYEGVFSDDERAHAREAARFVGAEHHEIAIGRREFEDFLPDLVHFTDEPLADLASVPLYYVSKLAAGQVKVVLSGEGSDEVLGGYDFDRTVRALRARRALRRLPPLVRGTLEKGLQPINPRLGRLMREADVDPFERLAIRPPMTSNLMSEADKRGLWLGHPPAGEDSLELARRDLRESQAPTELGRLLHAYRQSWLVEDLLMKADRMTMANSLELRVPFLDYRIVQWAACVPDHVKVRRGHGLRWSTKWVLREYCKGRVPESTIRRPKRGFPTPAYEWITGPLRGFAHELLGGDRARVFEWLRPEKVHDILRMGTAPGALLGDRHRLWGLLILETWARAWTVA